MNQIWIYQSSQWIYYSTVEQGTFNARIVIESLESLNISWRYQ